MTIALIDYGIGNLRSVTKALETVGAEVIQTDNAKIIMSSEKVVLPGVGAFQDGMTGLHHKGLIPILNDIYDQQIPLLGICLGMQLFFETSSEMGSCEGLGLIKGEVRRFPKNNLKVPHTGWNQIVIQKYSPIFTNIENGTHVYFNHGYYCDPEIDEDIISTTKYGQSFVSAVQKNTLFGVQFHPEKSQTAGLAILKNFIEVC